MLNVLYYLYVDSDCWSEDEELTIERLRKWWSTTTLLKLEFLSSLSLNLSMTTTRYTTKVILDQQEECFGLHNSGVCRFIKFLSKPRSLV
jgi:hypothetical protein